LEFRRVLFRSGGGARGRFRWSWGLQGWGRPGTGAARAGSGGGGRRGVEERRPDGGHVPGLAGEPLADSGLVGLGDGALGGAEDRLALEDPVHVQRWAGGLVAVAVAVAVAVGRAVVGRVGGLPVPAEDGVVVVVEVAPLGVEFGPGGVGEVLAGREVVAFGAVVRVVDFPEARCGHGGLLSGWVGSAAGPGRYTRPGPP